MNQLLVVVVNYRTAALVEEGLVCLEPQIARQSGRRVVVVDNASGDGSVERLSAFVERRGFGSWVEITAAPTNGGFAAGNNYAIEPALRSATPPDFVLLLNPDALVEPRAIDALLDFMQQEPCAGIAGSQLCHRSGEVQASSFRFPSLWSEVVDGLRFGPVTRLLARHHILAPTTDTPSRTDWVAGASMLVRREVFEAIGPMDAGYFLYFEETDFCRRAAAAGWFSWYVPSSRVVHLVGQSTGVTNSADMRRRRPPYWFDSRTRYFRKFHGRARTALIDAAFALSFALWRVRRRLQNKPDLDPVHFLGDFVRHAFVSRPSANARDVARSATPDERRTAA